MYLRDLRKPLELPNEDLQKLIGKLESITNTKFNTEFADRTNNFIGILRETILIHETVPRNKEIKREIESLSKALSRVSHIQDNLLSQHAQTSIWGALDGTIGKYMECGEHIEVLNQACNKAIEDMSQKTKPKDFSFRAVKQAMSTELARELDSFGIEITAYRDGVFEKCLRELFNAINGEIKNKTFSIYVAEDLFQMIKTAKADYKSSERFILLKFR